MSISATFHRLRTSGCWLVAAAVLVATGWGAAWSQVSSCTVCHSKINVSFTRSEHAKTGMTCVTCHGGDPQDMTASAMSPAAGFRGSPSRAQIPEFCSSCHSDRMRMRQYGLPADQLALYQTSRHGELWARGDTKVAVCTDCHTSHDILPPDDPRSSVAPANIPKTCARCHSDAKLMGPYGLASNQFDEYQQSVHGKVLMSGSSTAAPSCASCHGSHGAAPPGISEVRNVCGQCHRTVEDAMNQGFHGPAATRGEVQCASCHGNHAIVAPTHEMISATCQKCHAGDENRLQEGRQMQATIEHAQAVHDQAKRMIDQLSAHGRETTDLANRLQEAHTNLIETGTDFHSLIFANVERHTVVVEATAEDVLREVDQANAAEHLRRLFLVAIWGYIAFGILCIYWKIRRVQETQHGKEGPG